MIIPSSLAALFQHWVQNCISNFFLLVVYFDFSSLFGVFQVHKYQGCSLNQELVISGSFAVHHRVFFSTNSLRYLYDSNPYLWTIPAIFPFQPWHVDPPWGRTLISCVLLQELTFSTDVKLIYIFVWLSIQLHLSPRWPYWSDFWSVA